MLCLVHVLELEAKQRVWHPAILGGVAARKQYLIGVKSAPADSHTNGACHHFWHAQQVVYAAFCTCKPVSCPASFQGAL